MKQLMEAELIFDNPEARDRAVVELTKQGYTVELLDWVDDDDDGAVLSPMVWVKIRGPYEGSDTEFLGEMGHLAEQFGGDVVEAGLQFPPNRERRDEQSDDDNPFPFKAS
jgi:hypothetical protein